MRARATALKQDAIFTLHSLIKLNFLIGKSSPQAVAICLKKKFDVKHNVVMKLYYISVYRLFLREKALIASLFAVKQILFSALHENGSWKPKTFFEVYGGRPFKHARAIALDVNFAVRYF